MQQLFGQKVLNDFIQKQDEKLIEKRWQKYKNFLAKKEKISSWIETDYQDGFLEDIFENCLGYISKTRSADEHYTLEREKKNETNGQKADGALLVDDKVVAVIELKDQKTKDLDKKYNREESAVRQAFGYLQHNNDAKYVIVSNFNELRFYFDKATAYEQFFLFDLDYEGFKKLHTILSYESISKNLPQTIKEKSLNFEQDISNQLYKDYTIFRTKLFENILKNNFGSGVLTPPLSGTEVPPPLDKLSLLNATQKLIDRIVFILFGEDTDLLPKNTIGTIIQRQKEVKKLVKNFTLYDSYKVYFEAINAGDEDLDITMYNGGLFAEDELLNKLIIDDEVLDARAKILSAYNFGSDISVNILGHIFENSISELEEISAQLLNNDFDKKQSKRKKDGVFYTPAYITEYIVQNTLGKLCEDKREELNIGSETLVSPKNPKNPTKAEQQIKDNLLLYKDWLLNLKILDPACGSGAFLNQALEYLLKEHKKLQNDLALMGDLFASYEVEKEVLEHNLYGVDINEDAVEIAKLSLWLRTASKGRELTTLADKIVCANSLLEMPFEEGSFDVVIGNPPYVRQEAIKEQKEALSKIYKVANGTADLYVYFYELAIRLLKPNALTGFICSNKFFRAKYGENLREYILENTTIEQIADFNGVKVFEDATVDSAITIFKKQIPNQDTSFRVVDIDLENYSTMKQSDLNKTSFSFSNPAELIIKQKIEKVGTPLKEWDINIYRGILTGFNEAFIIDSATKDELIKKDPKSAEIIKPLLRGRNLDRYVCDITNEYLINSHNNPPVNIDNYPAIKEHLDSYFEKLSTRYDKGKTPYNLRNCKYLNSFDNPKVIYPEFSSSPQFSFDDKKSYLLDTSWFIDKGDKYLLACLNSKLIWHYLGSISSSLGNASFRMKKIFVEQIPIPQISQAEQQPFINLVDEILQTKPKIKDYKILLDEALHGSNFDREIKLKKEIQTLEKRVIECENEIDAMVYNLYDLSDEEIKIVEGNL